ncbi:penicillin acylase family protein [Streptomyces sp. NPDC048172]|uniref:penicillin acylase family protein n=1 Tax=Streptomyces sp. NPDC048172 TaxID=3365505 RepID=UPI003723B5E5
MSPSSFRPPSRRAVVGTGLAGAAATALTATALDGPAAARDAEADAGWKADKGRTYPVPGLRKPVRVTVDTWGVPHLYAADAGDLFQAQGFNIARDRLFQIDTWRRRGLGRFSEVLGEAYVEQDRAARLFLYRGGMDAEWAAYGPEARTAATRFAAGINAYVDWLDDHPEELPEEFTALGYGPARWEPEDVVRIRTHALGGNLSGELARAKLLRLGGPEAGKLYRKLEPEHTPRVPDGLDLDLIPDDVAEVFHLATAQMQFSDGRMKRAAPAEGLDAQTAGLLRETVSGSNAWAVSPRRTATGRPILAGDPHRENHALPGNRYLVHLHAPGLNIIGAGEPWNPGVSMGHNGRIAFGLTNLPADQTDLYVYDLDPDDPTRYRYQDGWERIRTVTEDIPVAGGGTRRAELSFTRHGPVVKVDVENAKAYAVRTVWTEPGTSPYLGSLRFQRAADSGEFVKAMRGWKAPGSNLVYADTKGDIGWVPGALFPKRKGEGYDGLLPVPGDGRYEWDGFHDNAALPRVRNPREGYIASANEYNFPSGAPVPTYEWTAPDRKRRIDKVLSRHRRVTLEDTVALQNDERSGNAARLLPYVTRLDSADPTTRKALRLLRAHDAVAGEDSAPAALFETWLTRFLYPAWTQALLPKEAADHLTSLSLAADLRVMHETFAHPGDWFGEGGAKARDALLLGSLAKAYEEVRAKLGADEAEWRWGALHFHVFAHPLGEPNTGRVARGGTFDTVRCSYYLFTTYHFPEIVGPTFRMALDVGAWDNSRAINAPGQSGDRRSPHFTDLHATWAKGGHFPLVYSDEAVEKNAGTRILLEP